MRSAVTVVALGPGRGEKAGPAGRLRRLGWEGICVPVPGPALAVGLALVVAVASEMAGGLVGENCGGAGVEPVSVTARLSRPRSGLRGYLS